MRIKFNIPVINNIKNKMNNVIQKINSNKGEKVPKKYYALLILMLLLSIITLSNNLKKYNIANTEEYKEYRNENVISTNNEKVDIQEYKTNESSISTTISTDEVIAIPTISSQEDSKYVAPLKGNVIKEFAANKLVYSKTLDMWRTHKGIDIGTTLGATVVAVSNGKILEVYDDSFYGKSIKLINDEGNIFIYSNLDFIYVKENDSVKQKDVIATVGASAAGEIADEIHLHFEMVKENEQINPLQFISFAE